MPKYLKLHIPESCQEEWQDMLPHSKGRYCLSCQKQVIDFTNMTDSQLVEFFKNKKENICGRFYSDQLSRNLPIPRKKLVGVKYFLQLIIPAFLFSLKSAGQLFPKLKPNQEKVAMTKGEVAKEIVDLKNTLATDTNTISGTVKDASGNPVVGATLQIKGTNSGVAADGTGNFTLHTSEPVTLVVSSVGYELQELSLKPGQTEVSILMQQQLVGFLGEVVVVRAKTIKKQNKKSKKEMCSLLPPSLSVYPNPVTVNNPLHLKWQYLIEGEYLIEVFNLSGAMVQMEKLKVEKAMTQHTINLKTQLAGNYMVTLRNEKTGKSVTQQVVVQQ